MDGTAGDDSSITLLVLGDSLTLPRADAQIRPEHTWPFLLVEALAREGRRATMFHRGSGATAIEDAAAEWKRVSAYVTPFTRSVCLLQVGIVDCAPRVMPLALGRVVDRSPGFLRRRIVQWFHDHRAGLNRFFTVILGRPLQRTPLRRFRTIYRRLLEDLGGRFEAVIAIGIAPADEAYERKSAGVKAAVAAHNAAIREVVAQSPRASLLDLERLFGSSPEAAGFLDREDHHHLSREGHARIASELARRVIDALPRDAKS